MITLREPARTRAIAARQSAPRPLPDRRLPIATSALALASCALLTISCSTAGRLPPGSEIVTSDSGAESAAARGPMAVVPTQRPSVSNRATWSARLKAGREHLVFKRYPEAEAEFASAMLLAHGFGLATQREHTTLVNLERVAEKYDPNSPDLIRITRRILPAAIELRGSSDPSVARHYAALANALIATGEFEDARLPLERAMAIERARQADDSLALAVMHARMADIKMATDDVSGAEIELRRASEIAEATLGPDSPALAPYVGALGQLLATTDRTAEAEALLLQASQLAAPLGNVALASELNRLAWFYTENDRAAEAETLALRAVELIANEGLSPSQAASMLDTLGAALLLQKKYKEAEVQLERAYQLGPNTGGSPFDEVRQHYAELLRATGREAEASALEAGGAPTASFAPDPAASEPAVSESAASEPAVSESAASEPAVSESAASEPAVSDASSPDPRATQAPAPGASFRQSGKSEMGASTHSMAVDGNDPAN